MTPRSATLALGLALLTAVPAADARSAAVDIIRLTNREERRAQVRKATWEGVVYTLDTPGELTESWSKIDDVLYHDAPLELDRAKKAAERGDTETALAALQKALKAVDAKRCRPLHRQYVLIAFVRLHDGAGRHAEAVKTGLALLDAAPGGAFTREAYERVYACARRAGDRATLAALPARIRKEPPRLGVAPLAGLAEAWGLVFEKKTAKALGRFKPLTTNDDPAIQADALTGTIRCHADTGKHDALRRACEASVRGANRDPLLQSAAWTGLGNLAFANAQQKKDAASYKEALMRYLRVVVLYPPEAGGDGGNYERALFHAAHCFERMAEAMAKEKEKEETAREYLRRARKLYEELQDTFPSSTWTKPAKEALAKIPL